MLRLRDFKLINVEVNEDVIINFQSEDNFNSLAVELMKEVGQVTSVLGSAYRIDANNEPRPWNRKEAILGGLMIRASKLQVSMLDQFCQNRMEITWIIYRCFSETLINIEYLLKLKSDDAYKEFLVYGLRNDKRLLEIIDSEVKKRGFEYPIEVRMRKSIEGAFRVSSLEFEDVDVSDKDSWSETAYKRAQKIGREEQYLALFGFPSSAVHGNWSDLVHHYIKQTDGGYAPEPRWTHSRPQILFASAKVCAEVNLMFVEDLLPTCTDKTLLNEKLRESLKKIETVNLLHEDFITAHM